MCVCRCVKHIKAGFTFLVLEGKSPRAEQENGNVQPLWAWDNPTYQLPTPCARSVGDIVCEKAFLFGTSFFSELGCHCLGGSDLELMTLFWVIY